MQMAAAIALSSAAPAFAADVDCASQAETSMDLNLSAGVYTEQAQVSMPLKLRIPTGMNPHTYAECLKIQGDDPSREIVRAVADNQHCRREAAQVRFVSTDPDAGEKRIRGELDADKFAECAGRGIKLEVVPTRGTD